MGTHMAGLLRGEVLPRYRNMISRGGNNETEARFCVP